MKTAATWIRAMVFTAILFCMLSWPGAGQATRSSGFDSSLDNELFWGLRDGVLTYNLPGAVLAVRDPNGQVAFHQAGFADLTTGRPMERDLYFQVGSVTKTFTATAVLMLVDDGLVGLEDTVDAWFPGLVVKGDQISIKNLLQMRSGLSHYEDNPLMQSTMLGEPHHQFTPEELVGYANSTSFEPGQGFDYNNVNYIILGMLIEKLTGEAYHQAIQDMILSPLGLEHTMAPAPEADPIMPEPYAHGYLAENGAAVDYSTYFTRSWAWSAGDMISTAGDMLAWTGFLNEGRLLSPETRAQRFDFLATTPGGPDYGMGITRMNGAVGHSGNYNYIYTAGVYRYQGYDISVLANGQSAGGNAESLARNIVSKVMAILDEYL